MTHEPECPRFGLEMPHAFVVPCFCYIAEAAYRRGREDAARGLTNWYLANGDEPLSEWESECVAAARGDGAK